MFMFRDAANQTDTTVWHGPLTQDRWDAIYAAARADHKAQDPYNNGEGSTPFYLFLEFAWAVYHEAISR
jgi:hypothetical protein